MEMTESEKVEIKQKYFAAVRAGAAMKLVDLDAEIYFNKATKDFLVVVGELKADGYVPCGYESTAEITDDIYVEGFESSTTPITPSWRSKYKAACALYHSTQKLASSVETVSQLSDEQIQQYKFFDTTMLPVGIRKQIIEKSMPHLVLEVLRTTVGSNAIKNDVKHYAKTADSLISKLTA